MNARGTESFIFSVSIKTVKYTFIKSEMLIHGF